MGTPYVRTPGGGVDSAASVQAIVLGVGDLVQSFGSPVIARVGTAGSGRRAGWLLDAGSTEELSADFLVPDDWSTFKATLQWCNINGNAGNVVFACIQGEGTDGDSLSATTQANVTVTSPAQYVIDLVELFSGVACTPGEVHTIMPYRDGANAADTLAGDVAVFAVIIEKVS